MMVFQPQTQLAPGTATFRVLRTIGAGGLGTVDEIEITASNCDTLAVGSRWARKRLNAQWADQPIYRARFEREIQALQKMRHASIISFAGENLGGERFYIMPVYPRTLRGVATQKAGAFPWRDVAQFGAMLADALQYAHDVGFIHRDLKPENILMTEANAPVIADWGLGYFVHRESKVLQKLTKAGLGTEYYASLEQWNTGKCEASGDVYSLGITLAELAAGAAVGIAFVGAGIRQDVVANDSNGARAFNAALVKMTALVPAHRHQTMREVAAVLRVAAFCS